MATQVKSTPPPKAVITTITITPTTVAPSGMITVVGTGGYATLNYSIMTGTPQAAQVLSNPEGGFVAVINLDPSLLGNIPVYAQCFFGASNIVYVNITNPTPPSPPAGAQMIVSIDGGKTWQLVAGGNSVQVQMETVPTKRVVLKK